MQYRGEELIYGDYKNQYIKEYSLKEKYLPRITLKGSQSIFAANF